MGHLVNANGFRIGWNLIWPNFWYSHLKFGYSNFLFICVRLRAFLRFFFYNRVLDKSKFIFSHFEIIKFLKHVFIKVYVYFPPVMQLVPRLFKRTWNLVRRWRRRYYLSLASQMQKLYFSDVERNWWPSSFTDGFDQFNRYFIKLPLHAKQNYNIRNFLRKRWLRFFNNNAYTFVIKRLKLLERFLGIFMYCVIRHNQKKNFVKLVFFDLIRKPKVNKIWLWLLKSYFVTGKSFSIISLYLFLIKKINILQAYLKVKGKPNFLLHKKLGLALEKANNIYEQILYWREMNDVHKERSEYWKRRNFQYYNPNWTKRNRDRNQDQTLPHLHKIQYNPNFNKDNWDFYCVHKRWKTDSGWNKQQYEAFKKHNFKTNKEYFEMNKKYFEMNNVYIHYKWYSPFKTIKQKTQDTLVNMYKVNSQKNKAFRSQKGLKLKKIFRSWQFLNRWANAKLKVINNFLLPSIAGEFEEQFINVGNCVWLPAWDDKRDVSILRVLDFKFINIEILDCLIEILNQREHQLDLVMDGVGIETKFSLNCLEFLDSLLENLYDRLYLSREQRNLRKFSLTAEEVIVAIIYAFRCQNRFFKLWSTVPHNWLHFIGYKNKFKILSIYYNFFRGFAYLENFNRLKTFFKGFRSVKKVFKARRFFFAQKHIKNIQSKKLEKCISQKFPEWWTYKVYNKRFFGTAFLIALTISGYTKTNFFDMSYFNVLMRAIFTCNFKLLYKFFILRWQSNSGLLLRTNMRQYFVLSSFLSFSYNALTSMPLLAWKHTSNRESFFAQKASMVLNMLAQRRYMKPLADCFKLRLFDYILLLMPIYSHSLHFYVITNDQVTSLFLSRYIAKKLEYHHKLRHLLNPLKKEFKILGHVTKKISVELEHAKVREVNLKFHIKILWKFLLILLMFNYKQYFKFLYKHSSLQFSVDFIVFLSWLHINYVPNCLNISPIFSFFKDLFNRRSLFLLFFVEDIMLQSHLFLNMFSALNLLKFKSSSKWSIFFKAFIYDWHILKHSLFLTNTSINKCEDWEYMKFGIFQYKQFLNLNYNAVSYTFFTACNLSNNLKTRLHSCKPQHAEYLGFKIKCSGRFSRKQRSSGYWFSVGSVPLNTVMANIEYSAYTVFLANSAITIKVWIQKSHNNANTILFLA